MGIMDVLLKELPVELEFLTGFLNTAPHRYKVYEIPKRSGGSRVIAQPAKKLKYIQTIAIDKYLSGLPVHSAAMAYRPNVSIKDNALKHKNSKYLLKMDFVDFFQSIVPSDLEKHALKFKEDVTGEDLKYFKKIFFWIPKGKRSYRLSVGAPSSPFISNTVMYEFDCAVSKLCEVDGVTYTRYADDLTFTTNKENVLFKYPEIIKKIIENVDGPNLKINSKKTIFSSKKNNRHVTGLVLNNENKISLGRDKKRFIKSLVYKYKVGGISDVHEINQLKGLVAYAKFMEPSFYTSLVKKYGLDLILRLK